jgi:flagellar motor component MotA
VEDPYIKKGVLLAVDGIEPDVIKDIMMAEVVDELLLKKQGSMHQLGG